MSQEILYFYVASDPIATLSQISDDYIAKAIEIQNRDKNKPAITLVFGGHAMNSSLVVARAFIDYMNLKGVTFTAIRDGNAFGYANRMGFFSDFTNSDYEYQKHAANGRFMEIEKIEQHDMSISNKVKQALDEYSMRPEVTITEEAHDILLYAIGELISNVRRHAYSSGRISFQYYPRLGLNEITVCDCGVGIIDSLRRAYPSAADLDLLKLSIKENITSSVVTGPYAEQSPGIGLYNVCKLAEENENAKVTICTKNYIMYVNSQYPVENPYVEYKSNRFTGTMVSISIPNIVTSELEAVLSRSVNMKFSFL